MSLPRLLVAGVGNIFLGDDAFGVEVAQRLAQRPLPKEVRVVDFGIRGLDLTYALLEGYESVILVDATPRGGQPGTLYVLQLTTDGLPEPGTTDLLLEGHGMDPAKVLRLVSALGGQVKHLLLVGCEPQTPGDEEEMQLELSAPVQAVVDEAVSLIESLVGKLLQGEHETVTS
jgi:hydrogenase maturation protease